MSDIPLMRAGLLLMAVIAAVGGMSMVVLPDRDDDDRDGDGKDRDRVEAVASSGAPAAPAADSGAPADPVGGFACRVDASRIALPADVHESSGLALAGGGDALWTHNDSGQPLLHLVGTDGRARGAVAVSGARVEDWEDVAGGPCPGSGRCLYVADIGDNQARRPGITIYRVPEPAPGDARSGPSEALGASYPDGAQDAEAMFVLPDGGLYVVTKGETGAVALYRMPRTARPGTVSRLERVAELRTGPVPRRDRITGASASPDGQWLVLRTLRSLAFYRAGDLAGGSLGAPLTFDLEPLDEAQGEAVEFGPNGVLYLSSEGGKKEDPATLARLTCTLPQS